jgi:hypothetical protein
VRFAVTRVCGVLNPRRLARFIDRSQSGGVTAERDLCCGTRAQVHTFDDKVVNAALLSMTAPLFLRLFPFFNRKSGKMDNDFWA